MRGDGLTENQLRVLRYLREFFGRHGFYATVRDVQKYMGYGSPSSAHRILLALEGKGRIRKKQVTRDRHVWVSTE